MALADDQETYILFICSLIWPIVDTVYVTLLFTLTMTKKSQVEASKFPKKVQWLLETLFENKQLKFFESCNQEHVKCAVQTFLKKGILVKQSIFLELHPNFATEEKLKAVMVVIDKLRIKAIQADIINNFESSIRKELLVDFPIMAKM